MRNKLIFFVIFSFPLITLINNITISRNKVSACCCLYLQKEKDEELFTCICAMHDEFWARGRIRGGFMFSLNVFKFI